MAARSPQVAERAGATRSAILLAAKDWIPVLLQLVLQELMSV